VAMKCKYNSAFNPKGKKIRGKPSVEGVIL
jgi:hypothetical protein